MKVCVLGLWHLGSVIAGCLAEIGHEVIGFDEDGEVVAGLAAGRPPVTEPGLDLLIRQGITTGGLDFTTDLARAIGEADVIWVGYDTPVDDEDVADVAYVRDRILRTFPYVREGAAFVISSQLPVGSVRALEAAWRERRAGHACHFACSPENLRLGNALAVFRQPDRIVVGTRDAASRTALEPLFLSISSRIEWMSVESAETTKHAINAFLATSIVFANELASVCEQVGADAREVARGLKTESRIGPGAYVSPGNPFVGGTLARDINFLVAVSSAHGLTLPVISAVNPSNGSHRRWAARTLAAMVGDLHGATVAIFGLTYKDGTDTLRRSGAIELARWLVGAGATVRGYDPDLAAMPVDEGAVLTLCASAAEAVRGADAVVLSTVKAALVGLDWGALIGMLRRPIVVDAGGVLRDRVRAHPRASYAAVGLRQAAEAA